jgi:hypothetical protein
MSQREEEELRARAAKRAEWAACAMAASAVDLDRAAAAAGEADRLDRLAGEVRELAKVEA